MNEEQAAKNPLVLRLRDHIRNMDARITMARVAIREKVAAADQMEQEKWNLEGEVTKIENAITYASEQLTECAVCGERKHTPLRNDTMGGYVCLTCIDKELGRLQSALPEADEPDARLVEAVKGATR